MPAEAKPIRLSRHAADRAQERGACLDEVVQAIRHADWEPTRGGRLECHANLAFGGTWRGREYLVKQVRPVFVDEPNEIVVVTVYVYYS